MLTYRDDIAVYLYTGILDMRVSFDRLAEKISQELSRSVIAGGLYVFFSRTRDRVRIIYWDTDGYAIWTKRLEVGSYQVEKKDGYEQLCAVDLQSLLSGVELSRIKFKKNVEKGLYK